MQIRLFVSRHDSVLKTLIWQSFSGVKLRKVAESVYVSVIEILWNLKKNWRQSLNWKCVTLNETYIFRCNFFYIHSFHNKYALYNS